MVTKIRMSSLLFGCIYIDSLISLNNLYFVDYFLAYGVLQGKIMSKRNTKTDPNGGQEISSEDEDPTLILQFGDTQCIRGADHEFKWGICTNSSEQRSIKKKN